MIKKILILSGFLIIIIIASAFYFKVPQKDKIESYVDRTGMKQDVEKYLADIKEYSQKIKEDDTNFDYYISLARSYKYLGEIDKTIEIYKSYPHEKEGTVAFLYNNNLAKVYEDKKDYTQANEHYLEIIRNFEGKYLNVFSSLIKNYIILKDKDNAWKYYVEFQKAGGKDVEILKRLEKMQ